MNALFFALAAASPTQALPANLPPIEECKRDPGFARFHKKLTQAVDERDRKQLIALLAPDVMVDFGGGSGRKAFEEQWSFDPAEYGNIWHQLETMLKLGCSNSEGVPLIPSLSGQLDPDGADEVSELLLVLPGARLLKEPGNERTATPVAQWTLVTSTNDDPDRWTGVALPDGRKGFISDDYLYAPLGYRMTFQKRLGKWMISAFVAGD